MPYADIRRGSDFNEWIALFKANPPPTVVAIDAVDDRTGSRRQRSGRAGSQGRAGFCEFATDAGRFSTR